MLAPGNVNLQQELDDVIAKQKNEVTKLEMMLTEMASLPDEKITETLSNFVEFSQDHRALYIKQYTAVTNIVLTTAAAGGTKELSRSQNSIPDKQPNSETCQSVRLSETRNFPQSRTRTILDISRTLNITEQQLAFGTIPGVNQCNVDVTTMSFSKQLSCKT